MKFNNNKINLKDSYYESLIFVGDIHGEFKTLLYKIKNLELKNSIIVVCGDIGMGFNKPSYYEQELARLQSKLEEYNSIIIFIRGNHDDARYFSDDLLTISKVLYENFKNIIFAEDYNIILTDFGNVLCVGGARSVDKAWRTPNINWWENEKIIIKDDIDLEIISKLNDISIIASHSSPDFCEPFSKNGLEEWVQYDSNVIKDCVEERKYLTNVYDIVKKHNKLTHWFYGHFHESYFLTNDEGVKLIGLNINEFKEYYNG